MGNKNSRARSQSRSQAAAAAAAQNHHRAQGGSGSGSGGNGPIEFRTRDELLTYIKSNEVILKNVIRGLEVFPDVWEESKAFDGLKRNLVDRRFSLTSEVSVQSQSKVPVPLGKFKNQPKTKFELYIISAEKGKAEAKAVHANFEKRVKTTTMNIASSFDSIEEEISSSGALLFMLSSDALQTAKCMFALKCALEYEKRVIVLHPKETCTFPKFEEQPLEFRDAVMMEDVIIYSQGKQSQMFKELEEILQLPERKLDRGGLLTVQIVNTEQLTAPAGEVKKVYCIIEFDQNGVILDAKKDSDPTAPEWKSKAKFDVASPSVDFTISLWCTLTNGNEKFLGMCKPTLNFETKGHQETYQLMAVSLDQKVTGSITVKTTYKKPEVKDKLKIEDFDLLKVIGKGTLGKVMQVRKKDTERVYAMKIVRKADVVERKEIDHIISERQVLAQLHHPFIVNLKFSFQTEDKLYLVLSFINGGELFVHLQEAGRFDEYRSKFYTAELLLALEYLHSYNIIYRDVKPENILLDYNGHIALCDFGLCKMHMTKGEKTTTFCGTPEYLAPELLGGEGYTNTVDWWTLGVLLYEMLTGLPPFYSENQNEMYEKILDEDLTFPMFMAPVARDLLTKLLDRDPQKRLGANGAQEIKDHPFFHDINWSKLMQKRVTPPMKPKVLSSTDTSNFDKELTTQLPTDSLVEGNKLSESVQLKFDGFTYMNESKMTFAQTPAFGKSLME